MSIHREYHSGVRPRAHAPTRRLTMMYPFTTLDDGTEIVHSDMLDDGSVKVYIERPDADDCFHHATCRLPAYTWEGVYGFSVTEMKRYEDINATKIGITRAGKCLLCNNNSRIPQATLRNVMRIIEARSEEVVEKWREHFESTAFYR